MAWQQTQTNGSQGQATDLAAVYDARVAAGRLRPDPDQRAALAWFDPLLDHLRRPPPPTGLMARILQRPPPPPPGLYLWGGVGCGKSMLMDLFFDHAPTAAKRRAHFHGFMQQVHAGMHLARQKGAEDALAPVAEALVRDLRLLAFDEMQITDITDAMLVGRLFQKLIAGGVVIVTTSNRPPDDLYRHGLNRALFLPFIALLKQRMAIRSLAVRTDYRRQRLQGAQVWFIPADSAADAAMAAIWDGLTGDDPGAPLELSVHGRKLVLPRHHNGVAWASFWDLCGQALGPGDFLAIAGAVRVLLLTRIPILSAANYNQAKRFVTLVDTLYEARVRVIASAADTPEQLYIEGEGTFEFERTASRLREMQAADWGTDPPEGLAAPIF